MALTARRPDRAASVTPRAARPDLKVVSGGRRRWPALLGGLVVVGVMIAMLGAAVFHTQLAERQLAIDGLERQVQAERERFDELRYDRAVLRSPQRIADEADGLGMVRGETSRFITIDPWSLAIQLAAAGPTDGRTTSAIADNGPLDQFRDVKSVSVELP
ncbi:MAG: hypothetical protein WA964_22070 [Ilumatobacter sp.]|uniref:hypothetical protein n=1 Tax=Ilumatobacter sp. TaxID=1967498 RepID=UPI003C73EDBF